MNYRIATQDDAGELAKMNRQLIADEGHRNPMTDAQLEERMRGWIKSGEYEAAVFEEGGQTTGYALWRREPEHVYLRQFFVGREWRRRGLGREAIHWLRAHAWKDARRLRVEVLVGNTAAIEFWRAVGYRDYALTLEVECGGKAE
jgi:predicted acetyltransferase